MIKFIKKLFHKHIFKTEEIEYLYSAKDVWNAGSSVEIDYYDVYAHHQKCLTCGDKRIIKKGELVISPKTIAI